MEEANVKKAGVPRPPNLHNSYISLFIEHIISRTVSETIQNLGNELINGYLNEKRMRQYIPTKFTHPEDHPKEIARGQK